METYRQILCSALYSSSPSPIIKSFLNQTPRFNSTLSTTLAHDQHQHEFSKPSEFLGSWKPPKDPKEAEAKLGKLRREYVRKVKELRKEYIHEMELQRQEKRKKDEAKKEAMRLAKEERKAAKAAMAQARAAERKVVEDEFQQTLLKERAENLENWRLKEKLREEKISEKNELIHRQSSVWIDESELEKKVLEALVDVTPL